MNMIFDDFASAFFSPGVNSQAELVPSPGANARNGDSRRWLGYEPFKTFYEVIQVKYYIKAHKIQNNIPTVHISEIHCYIVKSNNLSTIFAVL